MRVNSKRLVMRLAIFAVFIALMASFSNDAYSQLKTEYISLKPNSCKAPEEFVYDYYSSRGLVVSECSTNTKVQSTPLQLFVVSTDERSWIDLAIGNTIWSSEEEIVYEKENQFGYFPNVGNAKAELRISPVGAVGLIFRITAQSPDQQLSNSKFSKVSRLFVISFRDSSVCFLGFTHNNTAARNLLDSNATCKRVLKKEKLNKGK